MNDFELWAMGSGYYQQHKVVDHLNDSSSWAQASKYYEKLLFVVDM